MPVDDDANTVANQLLQGQLPAGFNYAPGQVVGGDYVLLRAIGQGGMGVVYEAEHRLIPGKIYAVKLLNPLAVSESNLKRFHREALALGKLSHEGIVRIYNFGLDNISSLYYVMEYLDGESLADYINREGPLNEEDCLRLFKSVCIALGHAHRHGIIHRDLKPSNLMLCGKGSDPFSEVKIVDFGLVRLAIDKSEEKQALTATGEIFGTPFYMSPEQSIGAEVTCASDVYSLGCTIFESLTDVPPFRGENAFKTLYMHQYQEAPWLKQVAANGDFSDGLEELVSKMLRKNPLERYQRMEQIVQDIERLQDGLPIGFGATTGFESAATPTPLALKQSERNGGDWRVWSLVSFLVIGFMVFAAFAAYWLLRLPDASKNRQIQSKTQIDRAEHMTVEGDDSDPTFYFEKRGLNIKPGIKPEQLAMLSKLAFRGIIIDGEFIDYKWAAAFSAMKSFKNVAYICVENMRLDKADTAALAELPHAIEISISNSRVDFDALKASKVWTKTDKFYLEKVDPYQICKNDQLERATDSLLDAIAASNRLKSFSMTRMRFSAEALKRVMDGSRLEELSFGRCRISPELLVAICHTPGVKTVRVFEQFYTYEQVRSAIVGAPTLSRLELTRPVIAPDVLEVLRNTYRNFKDPSITWTEAQLRSINKLGIAFLQKDSDYFYLPDFDDWRSRRDVLALPLKLDTLESKDLSP